tara:strand:+ start:133 stop:570 length:438 start_codon:yes stop_codon:yes gene_type:complete
MFIIENIFSPKVRKKIIKDSKKIIKLRENKWFCPDISKHKNFKKYINILALETAKIIKSNLEIKNSWFSFSMGDKDIEFHNHDSDYSLVYYLQTQLNNSGTEFKNGLIKVKQNNALVFDSILYHKVPKYFPLKERRTLVLELNKL